MYIFTQRDTHKVRTFTQNHRQTPGAKKRGKKEKKERKSSRRSEGVVRRVPRGGV
jgi:hypothetical protein